MISNISSPEKLYSNKQLASSLKPAAKAAKCDIYINTHQKHTFLRNEVVAMQLFEKLSHKTDSLLTRKLHRIAGATIISASRFPKYITIYCICKYSLHFFCVWTNYKVYLHVCRVISTNAEIYHKNMIERQEHIYLYCKVYIYIMYSKHNIAPCRTVLYLKVNMEVFWATLEYSKVW